MYNISISCNCPSNININYKIKEIIYKGDIYLKVVIVTDGPYGDTHMI